MSLTTLQRQRRNDQIRETAEDGVCRAVAEIVRANPQTAQHIGNRRSEIVRCVIASLSRHYSITPKKGSK